MSRHLHPRGVSLAVLSWVTILPRLIAPAAAQGMEAPDIGVDVPAGIVASSCLLVPSVEMELGTAEKGTLQDISVGRGDRVRAGQVLARLNNGVERAAVAHAEAQVEFAERKLKRNEGLHAKQFLSTQDLDEVETELELARLELREQREQLHLRDVVAPIDAIVLDRLHEKGDWVQEEVLFRLARINPLYVEAVVPVQHFGKIKPDSRQTIALPVFGRQVEATVTTIDPVVDPASGTFRVRMTLPNPKQDIPSGIRCRVRFE